MSTVVEEVVEQPAEVEAQEATEEIRNPEGYSKALKAEREARKALEDEIRQLREAEELRAREALSDQELAVVEAREAGRAEALAEYESKLFVARAEAKAAALGFHDPRLVVPLLELGADATDEQITDALEVVSVERPYLVKAAPTNINQGVRPVAEAVPSPDEWLRKKLLDSR